MIRTLYPEYTALLVTLPFLLLLYWLFLRHKQNMLIKYRKHLLSTVSKKNFWIRSILLILAVLSLIIALMEPIYEERKKDVSPKKAPIDDVVFLIDVSDSMLCQDTSFSASRLNRAKEIIKSCINTLGGVNVSLIAFTSTSSMIVPPTLDYFYFQMLLERLFVNITESRGTDLTQPGKMAQDYLEKKKNKKIHFILLTDGDDTSTHSEKEIIQAFPKHTESVNWSIIGLGSVEGAVVPDMAEYASPVSKKNLPLLNEIQKYVAGRLYDDSQYTMTVIVKNIQDAVTPQFFNDGTNITTEKLYQLALFLSGICLIFALFPFTFSEKESL